VVIPAGSTTTARLFAAVRKATTVRLYAEELELRAAPLVAAGKGQTATALMDAMASLWLARWEKDARGAYQLLPSEAEAKQHLPKNAFEKERAGPAREFAAQLKRLPRASQAQLLSGRPVPAHLLPREMLSAVERMTASINRQQALKGDENPFPLQALSRSTLSLNVQNRGSYNAHFLTLRLAGWGVMGWLISDDKAATGGNAPTNDRLYTPRRLQINREAAMELAALKKFVTVRAKDATLPEVLKALDVPFVSDTEAGLPLRADVQIEALPLGAALEKLMKIYAGAEWEYRKLGFLVIRAPENPARKAPSAEDDEKAPGAKQPNP
jgi:hypothetical protein